MWFQRREGFENISISEMFLHETLLRLCIAMGNFWDAWWQQTYQVKSTVLGNVRMLRTTSLMEIYLVSLLPPSASKSPVPDFGQYLKNSSTF